MLVLAFRLDTRTSAALCCAPLSVPALTLVLTLRPPARTAASLWFIFRPPALTVVLTRMTQSPVAESSPAPRRSRERRHAGSKGLGGGVPSRHRPSSSHVNLDRARNRPKNLASAANGSPGCGVGPSRA